MVRAEADRALAEERQRVDRLNEQVEALSAEVVRAEKQAEAVVGRAERAEAGRDAERVRADALRHRLDDLTTKLTEAQAELAAAQDKAEASSAEVLVLAKAVDEADRRPTMRGGRGGCWRGSGSVAGGVGAVRRETRQHGRGQQTKCLCYRR